MSLPRKVPGTKFTYPASDPSAEQRPGQYGQIRVMTGSAGVALGSEIAEYIDATLTQRDIIRFSNENIFVKLKNSVRGRDVYVIQGMGSPVNDNIMELFIIINTLKLDSAGRITVILPYYPYGRSDKKDQPRVPIAARLIADLIQTAGADRYMTIDLHAGQIQGFFSIPGDVLTAFHLIGDYFIEKNLQNASVVSTDLGFAKKGRNYAQKLEMPLVVVEKRRSGNQDKAEVMSLLGDIEGRDAIIIDDECDTGGTLANAVRTVKENGAKDVYVAFTHPVFSGAAVDLLSTLPIREIVTTNTIPIPDGKREKLNNLTILSIAPLLSEVIMRAHDGRSVGELFSE